MAWREQADEDWSLSWKQHWQPDPVGQRLLILPAWLELPPEHADRLVFTSDNPRSESAQSIVDAMVAGLTQPERVVIEIDRARAITQALEGHPNIRIIREEVTEIPSDGVTIIATGPLTSDKLSKAISELTHERHLYFFDAISPIIDAESINMDIVHRASRYRSLRSMASLAA